MVEKELLTVKEFAELAGVSVQSVYKKLSKSNNPIQRYSKVVGGGKFIERRAYDILYCSAPAPALEDEEIQKQPPQKDSTDRLLDILERQLEEQNRQLQEKDKQIAAKDEEIQSLLARLQDITALVNQEQHIAASLSMKQLAEKQEQTAIEDIETKQEKKSIWKRLFR